MKCLRFHITEKLSAGHKILILTTVCRFANIEQFELTSLN